MCIKCVFGISKLWNHFNLCGPILQGCQFFKSSLDHEFVGFYKIDKLTLCFMIAGEVNLRVRRASKTHVI